MALEAGTKLGPYEILSPLGAGGMGEVYRARDTKLGREVAIKVLPEEFTEHPERLSRFEREAKLLAALNHTNVATLYGLEEAETQQFLVMELVEGETLAERIARGPIPIDEALPLFIQMAEGLESAHEKGVIHRDLKPANVKITPEGKVKILDFGLARLAEAETDSPDEGASQSPTLTKGTALGVILGTASYMSPEQARGKGVDSRTDIWAFGCCLYEALTGKRAFDGDNVTDILAAVVRAEPNWRGLPANVETIVRRCLRRDRTRRFHHMGDVRVEIEDATSAPSELETRGKRSSSLPLGIALAGLVVTLALAAWGWFRTSPTQVRPVMRTSIVLDHPLVRLTNRPTVAITPDGRRVGAIVEVDGTTQIYVRDLSDLEGRLIGGTEGAVELFFSPDGESIGFVAEQSLETVSLLGGAPVRWAAVAPVTRGVAWPSDDAIVLNTSINSGLARLTRSEQSFITQPDSERGEGSHRWPSVVPGHTDQILFTVSTGGSYDEAKIDLVSLSTGDRRTVLDGGTGARVATSGHLVFGRFGELLAAPLDLETLRVTGPPVTVVEDVESIENGAIYYALSDNGTLVYVEGVLPWEPSTVSWVDREGNVEPIVSGLRSQPIWDVALSPDETRIAMTVASLSSTEIWTYDLSRGTRTRVTFDPGEDFNPIWSPDGEWIVFASEMQGEGPSLHRVRIAGTSAPESLDTEGSPTRGQPLSFSPDGSSIVFHDGGDLWLYSLEKGGATPLLQSENFTEHGGSVSPDGRWLAYHSDESGRSEVYVQPFGEAGAKQAVSTEGGAWPHWDGTGTRLFYRNRDRMMEVTVETEPELRFSRPRLLFTGQYSYGIGHANHDVSNDGRFLMIVDPVRPEKTRLRVVTNWFEELKRLVPTGNSR